MDPKKIHIIYNNAKRSAKFAGLTYLLDSEKGYSRVKKGKGFSYYDTQGESLGEKEKARVVALRIPPAWKKVWIAPTEKAHLQATGFDKKGIKQYLYHKKWSELREILKFYRLILFAEHLPKLRRRLKRELSKKDLSREKVLAAMLTLVDELSLRIGNEAYAESNKTFGITTLRNRHAEVKGDTIHLHFIGKSHQEHDVTLINKAVAKTVQEAGQITGSHLFQFIDKHQKTHVLHSHDVNHFIHGTMGYDFTAKDFRTWVGTAHAFELLKPECQKKMKRNEREKKMKEVVKRVAKKLGNTVAVCKAHYIHLDLQELFTEGKLKKFLHKAGQKKNTQGLKKHESELKVLLAILYGEKLEKLLEKK